MPNILAMSFEGHLAPSFDLRCLEPGRKLPDGWGIGYYPGGEPSASVLKEPAPSEGSIRSELVKAWQHLESSIFIVHIRTATWGIQSDANTQPFSRSWGGRDWMIAHAGSLYRHLPHQEGALFDPVGSTDTEEIFCELLNRIAARHWRSLAETDLPTLQGWLDELNSQGTLTLVLTDGNDLCVYADRDEPDGLFLWQMLPPEDCLVFGDDDLQVDLARRGVKSRKGIVISSTLLEPAPTGRTGWVKVAPGKLMVFRQGAFSADLEPRARADQTRSPQAPAPHEPSSELEPTTGEVPSEEAVLAPLGEHSPETPPDVMVVKPPPGTAPSPVVLTFRRARRRLTHAEVKKLGITHRTTYKYAKAVERSTHVLRLTPIHDRLQSVLSSEVKLSVEGRHLDYEDVFGNRVRRILLEQSFEDLVIEATSEVELADVNPLSASPLSARSTIPLVWMPWQRHMLQPYLLPPELPESNLTELSSYAMSFVERNDYDLLDTLLDMTTTIKSDYLYVQGSTNLSTTAFDVYVNRRGVCQDFTNLFICLARLLGVPARYVCGYLYLHEKDPNQAQAAASHAWVQVYLPDLGWRGFDPTNGVLTQTDHVRVAVGRSYGDATPTEGTIWVGGGRETMDVDVRVRLLQP
jgi:transglutaminase-like putative cysteine protease/predicted glutamine amidotransferase